MWWRLLLLYLVCDDDWRFILFMNLCQLASVLENALIIWLNNLVTVKTSLLSASLISQCCLFAILILERAGMAKSMASYEETLANSNIMLASYWAAQLVQYFEIALCQLCSILDWRSTSFTLWVVFGGRGIWIHCSL